MRDEGSIGSSELFYFPALILLCRGSSVQSGSQVAASSRLGTWALLWPKTLLVAGNEFPASPLGLLWETCVRVQFRGGVCWEKYRDDPGGTRLRWMLMLGIRSAGPWSSISWHCAVTKLSAAAFLPGHGPVKMDGVSRCPGRKETRCCFCGKQWEQRGRWIPACQRAQQREGK